MDLSLAGLWGHMGVPAKLVIISMMIMLFWCVYVAAERTLFFLAARAQSRTLAGAIGAPLKNGDLQAAVKMTKSEAYKKSYLAVILGAALQEYATRHRHRGDADADADDRHHPLRLRRPPGRLRRSQRSSRQSSRPIRPTLPGCSSGSLVR